MHGSRTAVSRRVARYQPYSDQQPYAEQQQYSEEQHAHNIALSLIPGTQQHHFQLHRNTRPPLHEYHAPPHIPSLASSHAPSSRTSSASCQTPPPPPPHPAIHPHHQHHLISQHNTSSKLKDDTVWSEDEFPADKVLLNLKSRPIVNNNPNNKNTLNHHPPSTHASNLKPFGCNYPECNQESFETSRELLKHWRSNHFKRPDSLGIGAEEKPFRCALPGCQKTWKNLNGIQYHVKTNVGKNGHFFTLRRNRLEEDVKSDDIVYCPHPNCDRQYRQIQGLRYHLNHGHSPPPTMEELNSWNRGLALKLARKRGMPRASTTDAIEAAASEGLLRMQAQSIA